MPILKISTLIYRERHITIECWAPEKPRFRAKISHDGQSVPEVFTGNDEGDVIGEAFEQIDRIILAADTE